MTTTTRKRLSVASLAALALILVGCTSPATAAPSEDCLASMRALDAAPDDATNEKVDPLVEATLNECETGDEWLAALRQYPGAQMLKDETFVTENLFELACVGFPDTTACAA